MNSLTRINKQLLIKLLCRPVCFCGNNFHTKYLPDYKFTSNVNRKNKNVNFTTTNYIQIRNKYQQKKTEKDEEVICFY